MSLLNCIGQQRTSADDVSPLYVIRSIRYRAVEYQINLNANKHKNSPKNMPRAYMKSIFLLSIYENKTRLLEEMDAQILLLH